MTLPRLCAATAFLALFLMAWPRLHRAIDAYLDFELQVTQDVGECMVKVVAATIDGRTK